MSNKASKESKLRRYMKAPIRILIKARDFYIQSMMMCDGQIGSASLMGCPTAHVPRSFSVNSTKSNGDDDLRELVRAASTRSLGNKVELDLIKRQQQQQQLRQPPKSSAANNMPRSFSVGIGRIDEDEPCEFGDDFNVRTDVCPRSRSYAVSRRTTGVF